MPLKLNVVGKFCLSPPPKHWQVTFYTKIIPECNLSVKWHLVNVNGVWLCWNFHFILWWKVKLSQAKLWHRLSLAISAMLLIHSSFNSNYWMALTTKGCNKRASHLWTKNLNDQILLSRETAIKWELPTTDGSLLSDCTFCVRVGSIAIGVYKKSSLINAPILKLCAMFFLLKWKK